MNRKLFLNPYLSAAISGILLLLSFPPFGFYLLAWIALVPFLYSVTTADYQKKNKWRIFYSDAQLSGVVFGAFFYYGTLFWLYNIFGGLALILIAILTLYPTVFASALTFIYSRMKNPYAVLFSPAILWVAIEFFKSEGWWMKFSWMNLGYTQHAFLPVLQIASVFGQYGMSFLIVLVNSIIVFLIVNRANKGLVITTSLVSIICAIVILGFGFLSLKKKYVPDIHVGLVQDESSDYRTYARFSEELADDIDIISWPEYAVPEFLEEHEDLLDVIKRLAKEKKSYLILGSKQKSEAYSSRLRANLLRKQGVPETDIDSLLRFYNTAFLISPEGKIIGRYHKANPIQFFTDGVAGNEFPVFETSLGRVGMLICYDMDYSRVARKLTQNGAEMLFIPTYDAMSWSEIQHKQHSAMTSIRAVENGRFIARAATSGISQIIDPNGRITSSIAIGESGITTGYIQEINEKTFYTRCGFALPYACIILACIAFVSAFLSKKNHGSSVA